MMVVSILLSLIKNEYNYMLMNFLNPLVHNSSKDWKH